MHSICTYTETDHYYFFFVLQRGLNSFCTRYPTISIGPCPQQHCQREKHTHCHLPLKLRRTMPLQEVLRLCRIEPVMSMVLWIIVEWHFQSGCSECRHFLRGSQYDSYSYSSVGFSFWSLPHLNYYELNWTWSSCLPIYSLFYSLPLIWAIPPCC